MQMLQKLTRDEISPELYHGVCSWVLDLPPLHRPAVLLSTIAQTFYKTTEEVDADLRQKDRRIEFDALVPASGWIHDYIQHTRQTEPPTVFHFFVAATVIGAVLGRNVFFDKGAYQVFPNLCVMIVAPTGRCRKTSACNMGTKILQKTGTTLIADKTTPEAFVDALKAQANATGLIYAPELAVFLGKQKYNEGMIPLLTALFDCPQEWISKTLGRGETVLTNVALSALLCSTLDWLKTSIPADSFGGGFMSRFLFVIQDSTSRSFPLPPPLNQDEKKRLTAALSKLKMKRGEFKFTPHADTWYRHWYNERPALQGDKQYAGYYERKPDHLIRLAMVMKTATADIKEFILTEQDLIAAERVLTWLEAFLPGAFDELASSGVGEDQIRILRHLRMAGGTVEHSTLLRRNSSRMNGEQFRRSMTTLQDAKMVEYNPTKREYVLTAIGWGE
jgi:hypothetical protein